MDAATHKDRASLPKTNSTLPSDATDLRFGSAADYFRVLSSADALKAMSKRKEAIVFFVLALLLTLGMYGGWLRLAQIPQSPNEDLAKHGALAINFWEALKQGQLLPRLQPGGEPADMPVFQYYGFFEGLAALSFLALGLSGLQAMTLALILLRWMAFGVLYVTCRLLKARPASSALAGFGYLLSPYLISNVLGRFAIAEVHAHNLLPCCLLAWALILRRRHAAGVIVLALTVCALALAHNVFLLYAMPFIGVLILSSGGWRPALALSLGAVTGILIAGIQWCPVLISSKDLVIQFAARATPFERARLVSLTGLWGWLRPYCILEAPTPDGRSCYFFTYPWWTLPAVAGLLVRCIHKKSRGFTISLLICTVLFFLLSAPPVNFWAALPAPFAAVQFPYRLIAFVALTAAVGLALTFPALSWRTIAALLPVMIASQWPAIRTNSFAPRQGTLTSHELARAFALGSYVSQSQPRPPDVLRYTDGWMRIDNHVNLRSPYPGRPDTPRLFLEGANVLSEPVTVFMVNGDTHPVAAAAMPPLSEKILIPPGAFSVSVQLDSKFPVQRIVFEPHTSPHPSATVDARPIALRLDSALLSDEGSGQFYSARHVRLVKATGYRREFRFLEDMSVLDAAFSRLVDSDGWLREDNLVELQKNSVASVAAIELEGANATGKPVRLFAASPDAPELTVTEAIEIAPGNFHIRLALPREKGLLRLFYSPFFVPAEVDPGSPDRRKLALHISASRLRGENGVGTVGKRVYLELPVGYNRFYHVSYNGKVLSTFSTSLYRLGVSLDALPTGSLTVCYRLPVIAWALSIAGLVFLGLQPLLWKRIG